MIVLKPDGPIRLCNDFKDLNAKTTDDGYQLPLVEDQLAVLAKSRVFTKLDLFQGYHQLWLAPEARAKTAFDANGEHYENTVLPFRLPDPILCTVSARRAHPSPNKVNLGIGAHRDDNGQPIVFEAVRRGERKILAQDLDKEYPAIDGPQSLKGLTQSLVFGVFGEKCEFNS